MSETDARMAFERHTTSRSGISTTCSRSRPWGSRVRRWRSIAAVAQSRVKDPHAGEAGYIYRDRTEQPGAETGTGGGTLWYQHRHEEPLFQCTGGTRNCLKSNAAELRHIVDEFIRVAMAFPGIFSRSAVTGSGCSHLERER